MRNGPEADPGGSFAPRASQYHPLLPVSETKPHIMSAVSATTAAFDEALLNFKKGLTDTEKLDFAQTNIGDVLKAAQEIQEKQGKRSLLRNLNRIKPYIDGLVQFSNIIEIFVQVKPEIPSSLLERLKRMEIGKTSLAWENG